MIVIELQGDMDSDAIAVEEVTPAVKSALDRVESEGYGFRLLPPDSPILAEFIATYGYDPSDRVFPESEAIAFIRDEWLPQPT